MITRADIQTHVDVREYFLSLGLVEKCHALVMERVNALGVAGLWAYGIPGDFDTIGIQDENGVQWVEWSGLAPTGERVSFRIPVAVALMEDGAVETYQAETKRMQDERATQELVRQAANQRTRDAEELATYERLKAKYGELELRKDG